MDQKQTSVPNSDLRAEAALELLRSLAKAGDDPDQFAQACLDWSRLSDDATSMPDFLSVLPLLSHPGPKTSSERAVDLQSDIGPDDIFSIGLDQVVVKIPKPLSDQLGLIEGDSLSANFPEASKPQTESHAFLIEVPDRFNIKRQVKVFPVLHDGLITGFIAYAVLSRLGRDVRAHLADNFALTQSEIEILELVLRRHSLEQIAEIRGGKLNTVRTHVSRLIQKLDCHSLVEAVSTAVEISTALKLRTVPEPRHPNEDENTARRIALERPNTRVEYRRYGSSSGHPVIVLHSTEYGYMPSRRMIEAARARHLNLIFPVRPGFGDTTAAPTLQEAADLMAEFIRVLRLEDVTLVGLSMAAPLALLIQDRNARVGQTLLVNYGLNVRDKLNGIQPNWVRGLLRMALNSASSFAFCMTTLTSMIRTFGGKRFYRMLYRSQSSDLTYVETDPDAFSAMADYIALSDRTNARLDIQSALLPNPELDELLARAGSVRVLNGAQQHGMVIAESKADAERLGIDFRQIDLPGRNWIFQHPDALFREMLS